MSTYNTKPMKTPTKELYETIKIYIIEVTLVDRKSQSQQIWRQIT